MTTELQEAVKRATMLDDATQHALAAQLFQMIEAHNTLVQAQQAELFTALVQSIQRLTERAMQQLPFILSLPAPDSGRAFLLSLGLDEELTAHVLTAPAADRPRELRLALQVIADEQAQRDPRKEPRYLTFEQFFRELGETDEAIEEAKRQAAAHADL
jgi:hypothetical protein